MCELQLEFCISLFWQARSMFPPFLTSLVRSAFTASPTIEAFFTDASLTESILGGKVFVCSMAIATDGRQKFITYDAVICGHSSLTKEKCLTDRQLKRTRKRTTNSCINYLMRRLSKLLIA